MGQKILFLHGDLINYLECIHNEIRFHDVVISFSNLVDQICNGIIANRDALFVQYESVELKIWRRVMLVATVDLDLHRKVTS